MLPFTAAEVDQTLARLLGEEQVVDLGRFLYAATGWAEASARIAFVLREFHARYPLRKGLGKEEVRRNLGLPSRVFSEMVQRLSADEVVVEEEGVLRLFEFRIALSLAQEKTVAALLEVLEREPLAPPSLSALREEFELDDDFLKVLVAQGRLVRVDADLVYSREAYDLAVAKLRELLAREERVTVAQVRDVFCTSRKYVLPLLEQMDRDNVTLRDGDERMLAG